jgi:hypothetical protein
MKTLTELYTEETHETPFDHQGGFTYAFTLWVMEIAQDAIQQMKAEGLRTDGLFM